MVAAGNPTWAAEDTSAADSSQPASSEAGRSNPSTQEGAAVEGASYAALANLLENDKTRKQLIEQLRAMAPSDGDGASSSATPAVGTEASPQAEADLPLSQRLALQLENFTTSLAKDFSQTNEVIKALATGQSVPGAPIQRAAPALKVLLATVIAVLVAYLLLRLVAKVGFTRLNVWIQKDNGQPLFGPRVPTPEESMGPAQRRFPGVRLSRKLLGVIAALLIDVSATFLAALAGYLCAITLAQSSSHTTFALQFLSAFFMIEVVKALSRGVFATRYDHLRLLPISPEAANYWNHWLTRLIGLTGYALMAVVPIVEAVFLPSVAQIVGLLIMLGIYIYAVRVVWSNRKTVRTGLLHHAESSSIAILGTLLRVLGRLWHVLAIAYFTVLLVVSQTNQHEALEFMASATIQSVAAVILGMLLGGILTRLLAHRLALPDRWRQSFPSLERRLNSYVPATLRMVRLLILIIVSLVVLDAWHAFDLVGWLESASGRTVVGHLFRIAIILGFAALSWTIVASIIEHRMGGQGVRRATEREKTLLMLFRNATAIVIATMTILILLSQIGINIGPLIAGAGVAGLAIGFGAQKLVQDVITGVFIQLENGMNTNDIVEVAGLFGTVEKITIRSVMIRTLDGGFHLIPFSVIDRVSNHTRDFGYHYGEYNIAHRESVDEAIAQLRLAFQDLKADAALAPEILEDIDIPGVTALNERGFTIRVLIKTTPGNQWAVQRGFNRYVKQRFDAAGIELPYPQTVVHFGRDKSGYAAPVDVRGVDAMKEKLEGAVPAPGQTTRPTPKPAT
ncbi:mechanosensitive ion channel [Allopusillimonas ginsengisoli]|nr:mechanosensitive ion channel [Allopusillimonas ginsengisoli]